MINIEQYKGQEADVNAYLVSDAENVVLFDTLRNSEEAEKLADYIDASDKNLIGIMVSHGHADHYIGLGVLHSRFPNVPVKVASAAIKNDIIEFSTWMESVGWLDAEPHMKVKSVSNPDGFDYDGVIRVLKESYIKLPLEEAKIQFKVDYSACECGHMTTFTIPEQKIFFSSDFIYNEVHAWCGPGVGRAEIKSWIKTLDEMGASLGNDDWTIYPGHGLPGDFSIISGIKNYLEKFLEITAIAKNKEEATDRMKELFPSYSQDDFLLMHSINFHVTKEG